MKDRCYRVLTMARHSTMYLYPCPLGLKLWCTAGSSGSGIRK